MLTMYLMRKTNNFSKVVMKMMKKLMTRMMRMAKKLTMMMMIMMNLEVEEGFYEVAAFPKDYVIKPVMIPNYILTGKA